MRFKVMCTMLYSANSYYIMVYGTLCTMLYYANSYYIMVYGTLCTMLYYANSYYIIYMYIYKTDINRERRIAKALKLEDLHGTLLSKIKNEQNGQSSFLIFDKRVL